MIFFVPLVFPAASLYFLCHMEWKLKPNNWIFYRANARHKWHVIVPHTLWLQLFPALIISLYLESLWLILSGTFFSSIFLFVKIKQQRVTEASSDECFLAVVISFLNDTSDLVLKLSHPHKPKISEFECNFDAWFEK